MVVDLQHRCETLILEEIKTVDGLRFRPPHQCQSFRTRHVDRKRRLEWIARFQTHERRESGSSARPASCQKDAGARLDARTIIKTLTPAISAATVSRTKQPTAMRHAKRRNIAESKLRKVDSSDSQAQIRGLPALLTQDQSKDWSSPQSRYF